MSTLLSIDESRMQVLTLDTELNVSDRLTDLRSWKAERDADYDELTLKLDQLNLDRWQDESRAIQIINMQENLELHMIRQPIYLSPEAIKNVGYAELRKHMSSQYARMNKDDQLMWLINLRFLFTENVKELVDRLNHLRWHPRRIGQQRGLAVAGHSGSGKTSSIEWFASRYQPDVLETFNRARVNKIDAPVSNRTALPLLRQILMNLGRVSLEGDESALLNRIIIQFKKQHVELLLIDEIEQLLTHYLRRRVLEIMNRAKVPIAIASCDPVSWAMGDTELEGRFNDEFRFDPLIGKSLDRFLSMIDLLLPFRKDSGLGIRRITDKAGKEIGEGPAHYIEKWTDGILREIMALVLDASLEAIQKEKECLTFTMLDETWKKIKHDKPFDFSKLFDLQKNGIADG